MIQFFKKYKICTNPHFLNSLMIFANKYDYKYIKDVEIKVLYYFSTILILKTLLENTPLTNIQASLNIEYLASGRRFTDICFYVKTCKRILFRVTTFNKFSCTSILIAFLSYILNSSPPLSYTHRSNILKM